MMNLFALRVSIEVVRTFLNHEKFDVNLDVKINRYTAKKNPFLCEFDLIQSWTDIVAFS